MTWYRVLSWRTGQQQVQTAKVGPPSGMGTPDRAVTSEAQPTSHTLRVGFLDTQYPPELFQADVRFAAGGLLVGPVDVPLTMQCDAPVIVELAPALAVTAPVSVVVSVTAGCCYEHAGATRSIALAPGVPSALPPWVSAVLVHTPGAVATWRDAAGVVLTTFGAGQRVPRPREASTVETAGAAYITEFYQ